MKCRSSAVPAGESGLMAAGRIPGCRTGSDSPLCGFCAAKRRRGGIFTISLDFVEDLLIAQTVQFFHAIDIVGERKNRYLWIR